MLYKQFTQITQDHLQAMVKVCISFGKLCTFLLLLKTNWLNARLTNRVIKILEEIKILCVYKISDLPITEEAP